MPSVKPLGCDGCFTTSSLCFFVEAVFIFGFGRRVFLLFFNEFVFGMSSYFLSRF
jgi:hypothetical protein